MALYLSHSTKKPRKIGVSLTPRSSTVRLCAAIYTHSPTSFTELVLLAPHITASIWQYCRPSCWGAARSSAALRFKHQWRKTTKEGCRPKSAATVASPASASPFLKMPQAHHSECSSQCTPAQPHARARCSLTLSDNPSVLGQSEAAVSSRAAVVTAPMLAHTTSVANQPSHHPTCLIKARPHPRLL